MAKMAEQKPHKPSKQRLRKARKEGKVIKSQLLTQSLVLSVCFLGLPLYLQFFWVRDRMVLEYCLVAGFAEPVLCARAASGCMLRIIGTCLLFGAICAVLVEMFQVGFQFEISLLAARAERLDLCKGLSRLAAGLKQAPLIALRLVLLVVIFFWLFQGMLSAVAPSMIGAVSERVVFLSQAFLHVAAVGISALLVFGVVEYLLKRRQIMTELSMSHADVQREHRDDEGDPYMRAMRRSQHEALLMQDLIARVRKAKVLVVER